MDSSASAGGLMIRSMPSSSRLSWASVTRQAISMRASRSMSSPVISQSIQTSRSFILTRVGPRLPYVASRNPFLTERTEARALPSPSAPLQVTSHAAPGRPETGNPVRQNALDPGFHGVPPPVSNPLDLSNRLDRRGAEFVRARAQPDGGPVSGGGFRQFAGDAGVEPGQVVDVDAAGPEVVALGDLGGAEVTAECPQRPAAGPGQLPVRGRLASRPAARDPPRVQPGEDGGQPDHLEAGERLPRRTEHADLDAQPALAIHARGTERQPVRLVIQVLRHAQRAPRPDDRQQLCDVTGERVPHQVGRTVFLVEPLRGRPDRNGARIGAQRQPDHARCSAPELSPVDLGPYTSGARHPRVSHRVSLLVSKRSRPSSFLSPAYVSIREVSIGRAS